MNLFIYKLEGPRLEGPRLEGPRLEGPRLEGPRLEGPRLEGPRLEGPRLEGPRVFCILTLPHASGKLCELHSEAGSHGRTPQGGWITWAHTTGGGLDHMGAHHRGGWITWVHTTGGLDHMGAHHRGGAGSHGCIPQGGLDHMGAHHRGAGSHGCTPQGGWITWAHTVADLGLPALRGHVIDVSAQVIHSDLKQCGSV